MRLNRSHVKPAGVVWSGSWDDSDGSAELSGSQKVSLLVEGLLERVAVEGESPVHENTRPPELYPK